ncbi:hypothetical protein [Herpetosiphon llansteffanensis]|uniref:hypothetical protein n=1 Tax=Herpetosiphon llansteffanensis TaxID=2094568 RepID=UPI000D7CDBED|nr:hypothetical protein [Herpetosiphon llansteffanensis]
MRRVSIVVLLLMLVGCGMAAPAPSGSTNTSINPEATNVPPDATKTSLPVVMTGDPNAHPRLWLTQADLPRLRAWASDSNPLYRDGLKLVAEEAKITMDAGDVPTRDCGSTEYEEFPTEMYAELFAFMSLIDQNEAARADYAQRARTLLLYIINIAAQGPAENDDYLCPETQSTGYPPFRSPRFFTEDSNRARWHGEAFPLVVDWIYPVLSASDKAAIRGVFLRWSDEIVQRAYHHPEPIGLINDPSLIANTEQVRWSGNNYFVAHMRNLGMMALAFDANDDPNNQLRNYLDNATGAWLYIFDHLTRTDSKGGLLPEGFEYSPQTASYAIQFLLALQTAGKDTCGQHCKLSGNPFWDDFVTSYLHSLSSNPTNDPNHGLVYQPAWYGDAQSYHLVDFINAFGSLGMYDQRTGNAARLAKVRWIETVTPPGGAEGLIDRVGNPNDFRDAIIYFMLFDPNAAAASDPRPSMALDFYAEGMHKIFSRSSWADDAGWFNFSLSWNFIDHQQADGNHFEWYRKGEWLTKARTGYADIAEGIASSEFRNLIALENDQPDRDPSDWRIDLWRRGSQWNLVPTGDPNLVAHSLDSRFVYALGDATNLYNSENEATTDITHASRSIVWLKPDAIVTYDRGSSQTANRFKRWWLQLPTPATINANRATMTTAGGQNLNITSLLPANATLTAVNTSDQQVENTAASDDPMTVRLRIDAPGNPQDVRFLQVLQATNSGVTPANVSLIEATSGNYVGAQIGSQLVLFPINIDQTFATIEYSTPSVANLQLITGLQPNTGYTVQRNGNSVSISQGGAQMSDSGGVLVIE